MADFVEHTLSAAERQKAADHLRTCSFCAHLANSYDRTRKLCRDVLKQACPAEMAQRLSTALRHALKK